MMQTRPSGNGSSAAQPRPGACLSTFFALTWLHMLWLTRGFFDLGLDRVGLNLNSLFHVTAWPLYSLLYLGPAIGLTLGVRALFHAHALPSSLTAVMTTALTLLLIRVDSLVYDLYAFHINSFVLNLLITPGGIGSLGSGSESYLSFAVLILRILLIQGALMLFALRRTVQARCLHPGHWRLAAVLTGLFAVQGTVYGISDVANHGPVLDSSYVYPLFQRVRFRSLAARFGFEHSRRSEFIAALDAAPLDYPRAPVTYADLDRPPNIVFLVAESLRHDQLTPETMPRTWAFSGKGLRFTEHYSAGNGTREGLFGMFYGLYGSYWSSFMHAGQGPLLMDRVLDQGYQLDLRTSAAFTYPEFDKTLFVRVPPDLLHTADAALVPWRRDEVNADAALDFLAHRDPSRPFMSFFFFESTHAPYSFPEESALTPDYQEGVDYTQLSRAELAANVTPLYNRYRNAAHWIDIQLGRIYAELERQDLLANTIVIVTGDHGEEFMENGAWGHNSAFVEEQTRVPLVVLMPGKEPAVIHRMTSHLDIATTLLQELGIGAETASYSLGTHLLDAEPCGHLVVSDWHSVGLVTPDFKYRIPYLMTTGANYWSPTDRGDDVLDDMRAAELTTRYRQLLLETMTAFTLFSARPAGQEATDADLRPQEARN
jgi:membrane-anchored protein YejM (alkaline phosphatase superfamily)